MDKRKRILMLRILLPVLALALVLAALGLYRYYGQTPKTLEEYYRRLYPRQETSGAILDRIQYDYPQLLEASETVLVVTPEEDFPAGPGLHCWLASAFLPSFLT